MVSCKRFVQLKHLCVVDGRRNQEVEEEPEVQPSAPVPPPPSETVPAFKNCSDTGKQLKKRDLDFCLKRTRFDEKTILFWFRSFRHVHPNLLTWFRSECPNGKLTRVHLLKLFSKVFPSGNAKTFCDHIFRWFNHFLTYLQDIWLRWKWIPGLQGVPDGPRHRAVQRREAEAWVVLQVTGQTNGY